MIKVFITNLMFNFPLCLQCSHPSFTYQSVLIWVTILHADSLPLHFTSARLMSIKTTPLRELTPYILMPFYLFKHEIHVFFQSGDVQVNLWMLCEQYTSDK